MPDIVLCPGAPTEPREAPEQAIYDKLAELAIPFTRADHAPAFTMQDCEAIADALACPVPRNLFLSNRQGTAFYLLTLPADKPFRTKDFSKALGVSRLSFGSEEKLQELLSLTPGAVSPLALLHDKENRVQFVLDGALRARPELAFHPARNHSTLRLSTHDLLMRWLPHVGHPAQVITF